MIISVTFKLFALINSGNAKDVICQVFMTSNVHTDPTRPMKNVCHVSWLGFFQAWTVVGSPPMKSVAIIIKTAADGESSNRHKTTPKIAQTRQNTSNLSNFLSPVFQPSAIIAKDANAEKPNIIAVAHWHSTTDAIHEMPVKSPQTNQVTTFGLVLRFSTSIRYGNTLTIVKMLLIVISAGTIYFSNMPKGHLSLLVFVRSYRDHAP